MKDGEFKKEGSISELKRDYGGFSIKLKLKGKVENMGFDEIDSVPISAKTSSTHTLTPNSRNNDAIEIIKRHINKNFQDKAEECEIKDEHSVSMNL